MRASILFPTRRRREYLAVALASVAGQAREHGAEIVVLEDEAADPATADLARRHGARYLALGSPQGVNAARNAAIAAASGDLLCLLDDDVEVWPGWLGALLAGAEAAPEHDVFGGPIRARLEGADLHACGREPGPVTELDLGPDDRDADVVWGANLALRRRAIERFGLFDPALSGAGDEEQWQHELRRRGGRIRYVARAGVDHRRAGEDARIRGLSRAAWHRGRQARRYDEARGEAPPLAVELRVLGGCAWHTVRRRCGNGIVMAAHTAGRLVEALRPAPRAPAPSGDRPYLSGRSGTLNRRTALRGAIHDARADLRALPARATLARAARATPASRISVLAVVRPELEPVFATARTELERSHHDVTVHAIAPRPGAGKWANLNTALDSARAGADWVLIVDDDVVLPRGFLDAFVLLAERHGLRLVQPAHAFRSHAAWEITRRRPGVQARRTQFVEIGPVTALHRSTFAELLPFPDLQMGWGLDAHWSAVAARRGWPMGVIDATPVRHTRPVAVDYPREAALAEADAFLATRPYVTRAEASRTLETWR